MPILFLFKTPVFTKPVLFLLLLKFQEIFLNFHSGKSSLISVREKYVCSPSPRNKAADVSFYLFN